MKLSFKLGLVAGCNIMLLGVFLVVCYVNGWDIQNVELIDLNMKNPEHLKILGSFIFLQVASFIVNTILLDT